MMEIEMETKYHDRLFKSEKFDAYLSQRMKNILLEADIINDEIKRFAMALHYEYKLFLSKRAEKYRDIVMPEEVFFSDEAKVANLKDNLSFTIFEYFAEKKRNEIKILAQKRKLKEEKEMIQRIFSMPEFNEFIEQKIKSFINEYRKNLRGLF